MGSAKTGSVVSSDLRSRLGKLELFDNQAYPTYILSMSRTPDPLVVPAGFGNWRTAIAI